MATQAFMVALEDDGRWRRPDTGEVHDAPQDFGPGAMWNADWLADYWSGPDGRCLVAIVPGGDEWIIDSQAGNCNRAGQEHNCWCRHGEPPNITVDNIPEAGRSTCTSGLGSIQTHNWHGFLRGGVFLEHGTEC